MTVTATESQVVTAVVLQLCPLCGAVLNPESVHILCPECDVDQAERWADHCAEQEQARHPY